MKKETQNLKEQNKVPFYLKDYPNICREFQGEIQWNRSRTQGRCALFLIMFIFFSSMVLMEGIKAKTVLGSIILIQVILAAVWLGPDMVKICKCLFMKEKLAQLEGYLGGEKEAVLWGFKHTYVTKDSQLLFTE